MPPKNGMASNESSCHTYVGYIRLRPPFQTVPADQTIDLVHLVGGPMLIALQYNQNNEGLTFVTVAILNLGVVPLVTSALG
jgi:hypothetical protein